jgi:quaternary ammonium compound-resistance protein SugE
MDKNTAWLILIIAGLFECGWAVGMKLSHGFTRLLPTLWTAVSMIVSLGLLAIAVKRLPLGTSYAVWTGIGAIGVSAAGIIWFNESAALGRLVSIGLIVLGIIGLRLMGD